jgi:hypothetical protein
MKIKNILFTLFAVLFVASCAYGDIQVDVDNDNSIDAEKGGTSNNSWSSGQIPYCSAATGTGGDGATGEFSAIGDMSYDGTDVVMGDGDGFCFGASKNVCCEYNSTNSRLECISSGTGNPVYFEDGISSAPSSAPTFRMTDTSCSDYSNDPDHFVITVDGINGSAAEDVDFTVSAKIDGTLYSVIDFNVASDPSISIGSDSKPVDMILESSNLTVDGTVTSLRKVVQSMTTTVTLTSAECMGHRYFGYYSGTTPTEYILPDITASTIGMNCCFYCEVSAVDVQINSASDDNIYYHGTGIGAGECLIADTAGEWICIYATDATMWMGMEEYGTLTDGGTSCD